MIAIIFRYESPHPTVKVTFSVLTDLLRLVRLVRPQAILFVSLITIKRKVVRRSIQSGPRYKKRQANREFRTTQWNCWSEGQSTCRSYVFGRLADRSTIR